MIVHAGLKLMNPREVSCERGTGNQNVGADRITTEIEEAVFGLRGPRGRQQVLDAGADGPTGAGVVDESRAVYASGVARLRFQHVPRVHPSGAAFGVDQERAIDVAQPPSQRVVPSLVALDRAGIDRVEGIRLARGRAR